ncbi:EF-P lysine aminoacylase EpmA [Devosia neptuniae]|jgi:lysyl-tRNA synthetase class 2|uniref:EF-P lysine aminoacylase EpmA n=1 Tax=Devosia TaxID=46913 RepID=UPI0022AEF7F7|nr:EF-P lysine aminoacylase EpmA [Devosia neptuniae]MCZ4346694.1 EF-P lysine aminoacylase EpmA [Devosia neptuniae]|tara:strand:- start:579 stop:1637 length:1059 start_codon:yes stop_codon:yes gene_type:complete
MSHSKSLQASAWWTPSVHADRRPILMARNRIEAAVRGYLAGADFVLVDPPGLQRSPGNETHLHAFGTQMIGNDGVGEPMYLHTSPEFTMKKLLAAGETRIASLGHVWRNRERSALHHPEFTMLEWYRAGEAYDAIIADCVALLRLAAQTTGVAMLRYKSFECDPFAEPERLSVVDAFARYAGIDLFASMDADGVTDGDVLAQQMLELGMAVPIDRSWSYLFSLILTDKVEPQLGMGRITVLDRYPAAEAALARRASDDRRVSERFELYACGVELANGFGELTDADEQGTRFIAEMAEKERIYGERYPIDEDFLAALALMPEASGVALGFDRLVMLATAAPRIEAVLWAPVAQ